MSKIFTKKRKIFMFSFHFQKKIHQVEFFFHKNKKNTAYNQCLQPVFYGSLPFFSSFSPFLVALAIYE